MNNSTIKITDFFKNQYVNHASYDNLRKIASAIDGQKNTARKILYTTLEKNIKDNLKVSQYGSKVAEFSEYLHGNLDGVIVNLAQDFTGSNNIPLLQKKGSFGTRFIPEPSAARYIAASGSKDFFNIFKKDDTEILIKQFFEGNAIEPLFYTPTLPMLLVNGSEGVSSGFAQKILPRCPKSLKTYIEKKIKTGKDDKKLLNPFYKGFKGGIEQGENEKQWLIKGAFEKVSSTDVLITEVPIGYSLKSYISELEKLLESKHIKSFKDNSDNDVFNIKVSFLRSDISKMTDNDILTKLKLIKTVTENFTCIDETNKIIVFNSSLECINYFVDIKLKYVYKRKQYIEQRLKFAIDYDNSRYCFIKAIVDETLKVNKRKKSDIEADLAKMQGIITKDGSYDYLLNMNIMSLTEERLMALKNSVLMLENQLKDLQGLTVKDLWLSDLNDLKGL